MLARGGLLRDTDPHLRGGNVPDRPDGRRCGAPSPGMSQSWRRLGVRDSEQRNPHMTVNLTRIYTKLGDGGETDLGDMSRVSKLHPRVEAYGTVDELNAADRPGAAAAGSAGPVRWVAAARAERPARRRRRPVGARSAEDGEFSERPRLRVRRVHGLARGGLRRGQRDARAAALVRDPRRDAGGGASTCLPHRLPARRAARDRSARRRIPRRCAT